MKVGKFLQHLPVRRQAAEKLALKMLPKVKKMLQAYALARPHLRLSLRTLKAKDRKGDWTYPQSGALNASRSEVLLNAATDMFGKKLTSQCELVSSRWSNNGERIDEATNVEMGPNSGDAYTFKAIIPKHDCGTSLLTAIYKFKETY